MSGSRAGPARIVIIGFGQMGRRHAGVIGQSEGFELVGVCDIDPDAARVLPGSVSRRAVPFYTDVSEMLAATRPDAAIVATPNVRHADDAIACMEHSVDVLIEKPIADSLEAARRIIEVSERTDTMVLVGHHRRHNPLTVETRRLLSSGALGTLIGVSALWALRKPPDYYDVAWRRSRPGGGPLLINLIHDVDSLRFFCGEISEVYACTRSRARGYEVEDTVSVNITFESGVLATILGSDATPSPWSYEISSGENPMYSHVDDNCYRFIGTNGSLEFPMMRVWRYADSDSHGWQDELHVTGFHPRPCDPLESQLEHFRRVVLREGAPLIDAVDAARSLAAVLAIHESAETGRPVTPVLLNPG